jgi:hypothetical protein
LLGKVASRPFIDMTVKMMKQFGVIVEQPDASTYIIPQVINLDSILPTNNGRKNTPTQPNFWLKAMHLLHRILYLLRL